MKNSLTLTTVVALFLALGLDSAMSAPGRGRGKGKSKAKASGTAEGKSAQGPVRGRAKGSTPSRQVPAGQEKKRAASNPYDQKFNEWKVKARIHDRDRAAVQTYYEKFKQHPHGLPPGLARNLLRGKPLPPGWEKKLSEGWIIDDAWWGHFQPVPPAYLPLGFSHPRDTGIYLIGDRLVRVHRPRREVIDIVHVNSIEPGVIPGS